MSVPPTNRPHGTSRGPFPSPSTNWKTDSRSYPRPGDRGRLPRSVLPLLPPSGEAAPNPWSSGLPGGRRRRRVGGTGIPGGHRHVSTELMVRRVPTRRSGAQQIRAQAHGPAPCRQGRFWDGGPGSPPLLYRVLYRDLRVCESGHELLRRSAGDGGGRIPTLARRRLRVRRHCDRALWPGSSRTCSGSLQRFWPGESWPCSRVASSGCECPQRFFWPGPIHETRFILNHPNYGTEHAFNANAQRRSVPGMTFLHASESGGSGVASQLLAGGLVVDGDAGA